MAQAVRGEAVLLCPLGWARPNRQSAAPRSGRRVSWTRAGDLWVPDTLGRMPAPWAMAAGPGPRMAGEHRGVGVGVQVPRPRRGASLLSEDIWGPRPSLPGLGCRAREDSGGPRGARKVLEFGTTTTVSGLGN